MLRFDHHPLQEVDEPGPLGGGSVLPVVAAVDPDHRVHRTVGALRQLGLVRGVVGGEPGQRGQVAAGRTARHRNEIAVTAELVDVGPRPGDGGLDVGDVARPAVVRRDAVVDRQAHPALLGQPRHQRGALQHAAAVHPGAAGDEDQHRRGLAGRSLRRQTSSTCAGLFAVVDCRGGRGSGAGASRPRSAASVPRWAIRRPDPRPTRPRAGPRRRPRGCSPGPGGAASLIPGRSEPVLRHRGRTRARAGRPRRPSRSRRPAARGACRPPAAKPRQRLGPAHSRRGGPAATISPTVSCAVPSPSCSGAYPRTVRQN